MKKSVKRRNRSVKPRKSRSVKRRSRSVKPRRSRRSVKPRKSIKKRKKQVDTGDFSDTYIYNIDANVIKKLTHEQLNYAYLELKTFLENRKKILEKSGISTVKVDMQIKSAEEEIKFLKKCIEAKKPWQKDLILLNSMP